MKILKSILNYIPLATFIIFVVTDGIFSLTSALIFVISTIGLLINWKRKKQRWRIEKISVCRIQKFNMKCEIERMEIIYTFYFFAFLKKVIKKLLTFCYWKDSKIYSD